MILFGKVFDTCGRHWQDNLLYSVEYKGTHLSSPHSSTSTQPTVCTRRNFVCELTNQPQHHRTAAAACGTPPLCAYTGMLLLVIVLCALHSHEAARDLMTRTRFRRGRERERVFLAKRIVLPLRHAIALMYHTVMLLVASLGSNIILHKNWFLPSGDVGYATHGAIAISPLSNL